MLSTTAEACHAERGWESVLALGEAEVGVDPAETGVSTWRAADEIGWHPLPFRGSGPGVCPAHPEPTSTFPSTPPSLADGTRGPSAHVCWRIKHKLTETARLPGAWRGVRDPSVRYPARPP